MREAGEKNILCFKALEKHIKPGITTDKINKIVEDFLKANDCVSGTLGFEGYPKSVCVSVNDEVVHGIPGKGYLKMVILYQLIWYYHIKVIMLMLLEHIL